MLGTAVVVVVFAVATATYLYLALRFERAYKLDRARGIMEHWRRTNPEFIRLAEQMEKTFRTIGEAILPAFKKAAEAAAEAMKAFGKAWTEMEEARKRG